MKIVYLTAGAAGMVCGSCLHDHALAQAMQAAGEEMILQPIYTPIRLEDSLPISDPKLVREELFFGGIHVYLLQRLPGFRFLPRRLRRLLDSPSLIRRLTARAVKTDPAQLGALTVSMLRGKNGRQAEEVQRLTSWLAEEIKPDAIVLSNLLIGGSLSSIRERLPDTKVVVVFQGDDIFLDHLPDQHRSEVIALMSGLDRYVDRYVTHSRFYRDKMASILGIEEAKFDIHPLSIDTRPYEQQTQQDLYSKSETEFRVGYLARVAPEKGLHTLVDSFIDIANSHAEITLHVAGWLGEHNQPYLDELQRRIDQHSLTERFVYHGSPSLSEKIAFLRSLDVLSVPTTYEEPKGLFVLEALAAGVPVIQPDHGAFPELIQATGGGVCFPAEDHHALGREIVGMLHDQDTRSLYSDAGRTAVAQNHTIETSVVHMQQTLQRC